MVLRAASVELAGLLEQLTLEDDGLIPNSSLPVLVYRQVLRRDTPAERLRAHFAAHRWSRSWVAGIFNHHHYHSTAHEVLGITKGCATVQLGGDRGKTVEVSTGDVVVVPAGTGHKRLDASGLEVVGAYPDGQVPDLCDATPSARSDALANLGSVPLPDEDPVFGGRGKLREAWRG